MIEIEIGKNLADLLAFVAICAVAIGGEYMIAIIESARLHNRG